MHAKHDVDAGLRQPDNILRPICSSGKPGCLTAQQSKIHNICVVLDADLATTDCPLTGHYFLNRLGSPWEAAHCPG